MAVTYDVFKQWFNYIDTCTQVEKWFYHMRETKHIYRNIRLNLRAPVTNTNTLSSRVICQYDSACNCFFGLKEILHEQFQANRKLGALNKRIYLKRILTWPEKHLMMCTPTPPDISTVNPARSGVLCSQVFEYLN